MNRQEKIEFIYEKIADKTLSFGCMFYEGKTRDKIFRVSFVERKWKDWRGVAPFYKWICTGELPKIKTNKIYFLERSRISTTFEQEIKIIWHPIMIGNILEYFYWDVRFSDFAWVWKKLKEPLEEQNDECIDFIYDILIDKK